MRLDRLKKCGRAHALAAVAVTHLSLMAAIGLWLWSDPSKFGTPITDCDPSLTVVGGAVPFSTPGLRIFSLAIYSVLVIPGLNLVPPFLFFLALHITYNSSHMYGIVRRAADALRSIPKSIIAIIRSQHSSAADLESGTQHPDPPTTRAGPSAPAESAVTPLKNHMAFLIVGLFCLAIINVILLGVLALLLLVVPLRDFLSSILDIQERVEEKRRIQSNFEERLRGGVEGGTVEAEIFKDLIERGADPTVEIEGALPVKKLLELAASRGNEDLVRYLQELGAEDKGGRAFFAAAWNKQFVTASLLKDGNKSHMAETIRGIVALAVTMLGDSDSSVRQAAIECISSLAGQEQLQPEIRSAIPSFVKMLEVSDWRVRRAAVTCISSLAGQEQLQPGICAAIPGVVKMVEHYNRDVRQAAITCISSLAGQEQLRQVIRAAIPGVVKMLEDSDWHVREAAVT
ncbi:armadillo-type protein [Mycena olivaceomarginata]|nr:armadillo-type protein [Mycena olivaceomarginata]